MNIKIVDFPNEMIPAAYCLARENYAEEREYVPVLVYGEKVKEGVDLGVRKTFADLGQTVSDYLGLGAGFGAESFLKDILK